MIIIVGSIVVLFLTHRDHLAFCLQYALPGKRDTRILRFCEPLSCERASDPKWIREADERGGDFPVALPTQPTERSVTAGGDTRRHPARRREITHCRKNIASPAGRFPGGRGRDAPDSAISWISFLRAPPRDTAFRSPGTRAEPSFPSPSQQCWPFRYSAAFQRQPTSAKPPSEILALKPRRRRKTSGTDVPGSEARPEGTRLELRVPDP